jgi:hypothetical protein
MLCWRLGDGKAADYIGHRDITTTKKYDRAELFDRSVSKEQRDVRRRHCY